MHILEARGNDNKDKTKHIYKVQHKGRVREGGVKDMEIWAHNPPSALSGPTEWAQYTHHFITTFRPTKQRFKGTVSHKLNYLSFHGASYQQSNDLKGQFNTMLNCNPLKV